MKLAEAIARFLDSLGQKESAHPKHRPAIDDEALMQLTEYFSRDLPLADITPSMLRDFLGRWYAEKACAPNRNYSEFKPDELPETAPTVRAESDQSSQARRLFDSLGEFFIWADQQMGTDLVGSLSPVLSELRKTLPRALEITNALSAWLRERGGAFSFPEFLTSFEEGGSSQYDIDVPGSIGAIDGYFRILRVEGSLVEAEELISEERVWPIVFPSEAAALLSDGYIIHLELVRKVEGWQIAGCGFTYPPGTEI